MIKPSVTRFVNFTSLTGQKEKMGTLAPSSPNFRYRNEYVKTQHPRKLFLKEENENIQ